MRCSILLLVSFALLCAIICGTPVLAAAPRLGVRKGHSTGRNAKPKLLHKIAIRDDHHDDEDDDDDDDDYYGDHDDYYDDHDDYYDDHDDYYDDHDDGYDYHYGDDDGPYDE